MAVQTGRTVGRFCKIQIEDAGGTLRDFPVTSIGGVGITYDEVDLSAMQEAVKSFLSGQGVFALTLSGPWDSAAAVTASASGESAAAKLSGSHTVLSALNGGLTPRAFGVYFGVRHDWEAGEPVFGADNCVIVTEYTASPDAGTYSAKIAHVVGGTAPAWGTTAIAVA